jgi:hypothetical protein
MPDKVDSCYSLEVLVCSLDERRLILDAFVLSSRCVLFQTNSQLGVIQTEMDTIELFLYINLYERAERKVQLLECLQRLEVPAHKIRRVAAVQNDQGFLGCAASHIKALDLAIALGLERVCIMEDDFTNQVSPSIFRQRVQDAVQYLEGNSFDVLFLAMTPIRLQDTQQEGLHKVEQALAMSGYIVNKAYVRKLRQILATALQAKVPIDMETQKYQSVDAWYGFFPVIGHQQAGYSDIERRVVDYEELDVRGQMLQK